MNDLCMSHMFDHQAVLLSLRCLSGDYRVTFSIRHTNEWSYVMTCSVVRRIGWVAALGAALSFTLAHTAAAAPREVQNAERFVIPAGEACAFTLIYEADQGMVRTVRLEDKNGNIVRLLEVRTGVVLTFTNEATGESINFKTSGSVKRTVTDSNGVQTVTATGHNGLIMFSTDVPPTSATQYTGKLVYTVDPANVFTFVSSSNAGTDICAELT
jgi:hypothetical protein